MTAQRAGIKDVAAAAGVSIKTVSRVINGVTTVDPDIRARVEAASRALHYVPNSSARSLKTGAGSAVGIVVDSIDDVFFSSIISAVEDRAIRSGLDVLVGSTGHDPVREREQVLRLTGHGVRGLVLAPVGDEHEYLAPFRSSMPVVAVDRRLPGYDSVAVDDAAAATTGVEVLIGSGHRRIAFLGFDPRFSTSRQRRAAYDAVLRGHGLPLDERLVPAAPGAAQVGALDGVLALDDPPTAVFLSDARNAPAVVAALHARGRRDVAVLSFGDFSLADTVQPAISCIDQDPYEIGRLAVDRLLELLDAPDSAPVEATVVTGFLARASHLPAPADATSAGAAR